MTTEASILDIDPELLALLRETGIDPQVYLKRQAELKAWKRSPEEEAQLAREQEELRPYMDWCAAFTDKHGIWYDAHGDNDWAEDA